MYKIILASKSPRRQQLLAGLDLDFTVKVLEGLSETYPSDIPKKEVAQYLAVEKAKSYRQIIKEDELVITADTTVVVDNDVLGKPVDSKEAKQMLRKISGRTHEVVTGVCFTTQIRQHSFSVSTDVSFKELSENEINYYVNKYHPYDKAGAYGIQEWIGHIGVTRIEGSYFNVMGLPVQRMWDELHVFCPDVCLKIRL